MADIITVKDMALDIKPSDIHYWQHPKTKVWNPSIEIEGKKARLRAGIIIIKDGKYILLGEEEQEPGIFSLPGGGIDKGETPIEAAVREAQEEVKVNVKNARNTGCDYCSFHTEVMPWVKENVPEEEQWQHYYCCLVIADYDGPFEGNTKSEDEDPVMNSTAQWYPIEEAIKDPNFKEQWKKALVKFGYLEDGSMNEAIEKHDTLNPKLWDDNKTLKPEVKEKINEIVNDFLSNLKEDKIKINVDDIRLVGSNCSYNYTDDSDLDVHIIANVDSLDCPEGLYPLLYSAYRSIYNSNHDIDFYGIPVELYVETEPGLVSNGIYSVKEDKWLNEPVQEAVPEIDQEAFEALFKEWEDKYFKLLDSLKE